MKTKNANAVAAIAIALFAIQADGAVIYDNQATFISTIQSGYYLESFQSTAPPNYSSNGFSYTLTSTASAVYNVGGRIGSGMNSLLTINFTSDNVTAVAGRFWVTDIDGLSLGTVVQIFLSDGTEDSFMNFPSDFRGYVSDGPNITSLTLAAPGAFLSNNVDDLIVGAAVPEPSAALLLGLSMFGVLIRRRSA